ncbi:hypothetical protein LEP1GSC073_3748 [Leptospira noguchii str. Cascata]|nr:hypothetical protein LEP1GSC073_3748 [Leptospira noguchii str. Cascata]
MKRKVCPQRNDPSFVFNERFEGFSKETANQIGRRQSRNSSKC